MRNTLAIHTARAKPRRRRQSLRKARERLERVGGPAIVPVPFFLEAEMSGGSARSSGSLPKWRAQNEQFLTYLDQCNDPSRSHPLRSAAPLVGRLSVRHRRHFLVCQVFQLLRQLCPETRTDFCLPTT